MQHLFILLKGKTKITASRLLSISIQGYDKKNYCCMLESHQIETETLGCIFRINPLSWWVFKTGGVHKSPHSQTNDTLHIYYNILLA